LEYLVYAINRTMFFTYEWFWSEILEALCENVVIAFNRYTVSQSNLYSFCEIVCGCKAKQSEYNKQRICKSMRKSKTSNCNTLGMGKSGNMHICEFQHILHSVT